MQAVSPYQFFIFPSFNPISLCSCKFLFCWFTKNIFCSPSLYLNKKCTKKIPKNPSPPSHKKILLPSHLPLPFPTFFSYLYSSTTRKLSIYKPLKENTHPKKWNINKIKKEEDCSVQISQKDIRKIALSIILKKLKMPIL